MTLDLRLYAIADPAVSGGRSLAELARSIGGFSVGVAAHPLGHPNSPDRASACETCSASQTQPSNSVSSA